MAQGVWIKVFPPPPVVKPELPGLGGWADITAVTGNPTKHQYKDAAGVDWVAYEWTASGTITTTAGMVDSLVVGGASGTSNMWGNAGRITAGTMLIPAGSNTVSVGTGGTSLAKDWGQGSVLGPYSVPMVTLVTGSLYQVAGSGYDLATRLHGFPSSITGVSLMYAEVTATPRANSGSASTAQNTAGSSGVVIVRVPAANAKA